MTSVLHQQQTECEYGVQVEQSNYKPTSYNSQPRASLELRLPISHPVIPSNAQDTVPEEEISTAKEKNTVRSTNRSRGILEVNTSSVNDINETNRVFVDNLIQPLRSISKSKKNENSAMKERNSAKKEKMPLQNRNNNLPHQRKPNIPRKFKESSQSSSLNSIELHNNLNYPVQKNQENHHPQRELNTSLHETFQSFSSIQPKDASMTKYLTFPESKFNSENGSKILQNLPDKSAEGDFVSQVEKALERSRLTVDLIKDISQSEVFEQIDWKFSARVPVGGITERLEKLLDNYEIPQ